MLVAGAGCGDTDPAQSSSSVTVENLGDRIRLHTGIIVADIQRDPYRLVLSDQTGAALTAEADQGGVFYERNGTTQQLTQVQSDAAQPDGVTLTVGTTEGSTAAVSVRAVTARTLEITVEPPAAETVTALG